MYLICISLIRNWGKVTKALVRFDFYASGICICFNVKYSTSHFVHVNIKLGKFSLFLEFLEAVVYAELIQVIKFCLFTIKTG